MATARQAGHVGDLDDTNAPKELREDIMDENDVMQLLRELK